MIIAYLFIALIALAAVYLIIAHLKANKRKIFKVEAGSLADIDIDSHNELSEKYISIWKEFKNTEGKRIDKSKYDMVEIDGVCMDPIEIKKGDLLLYEKLLDRSNVKEGDLIVLGVYDEKRRIKRKIRIVNEILKNEERPLATYYFKEINNQWYKKRSSINHTYDQVMGIVRFRIV